MNQVVQVKDRRQNLIGVHEKWWGSRLLGAFSQDYTVSPEASTCNGGSVKGSIKACLQLWWEEGRGGQGHRRLHQLVKSAGVHRQLC